MKEVINALSATELTSLRKLQVKADEARGGTIQLTSFQRGAMKKAYGVAKAAGKTSPEMEALATKLGLTA
jgi:hypothetical protein